MNGRVYDPLTAQFFSPDPYVQAPDNWLNYNRYGYCFGNPFRYTDPSGNSLLGVLILGNLILNGIEYLAGVRDSGGKDWTPHFTPSFGMGYSASFGYYAGVSLDGGLHFANVGFNSNGLTLGASSYGFTTMENVNSKPIDYYQRVREAEAKGINDAYNDASGYDYGPNMYDNQLSENVKPYDLRKDGAGAFINYGSFYGFDTDYQSWMAGVEISVRFYALLKNPMPNAYWIQYITTNQPDSRRYYFMTKFNGNMYSYYDDSQSGYNQRYYSWSRMQEQNHSGYAIDFNDAPRRYFSPYMYTSWNANLYLINDGHVVMRLSYGWTTNFLGYAVPRPFSYYVNPEYR